MRSQASSSMLYKSNASNISKSFAIYFVVKKGITIHIVSIKDLVIKKSVLESITPGLLYGTAMYH